MEATKRRRILVCISSGIVVLAVAIAVADSTSCWNSNQQCKSGPAGMCTPENQCFDWGSTNTCGGIGGINFAQGHDGSSIWRYVKKTATNVMRCEGMAMKDCQQCIPPDDGSKDTCTYSTWCTMSLYNNMNCTPESLCCWIDNKYVACMGTRDTPTENPPDDYCD